MLVLSHYRVQRWGSFFNISNQGDMKQNAAPNVIWTWNTMQRETEEFWGWSQGFITSFSLLIVWKLPCSATELAWLITRPEVWGLGFGFQHPDKKLRTRFWNLSMGDTGRSRRIPGTHWLPVPAVIARSSERFHLKQLDEESNWERHQTLTSDLNTERSQLYHFLQTIWLTTVTAVGVESRENDGQYHLTEQPGRSQFFQQALVWHC